MIHVNDPEFNEHIFRENFNMHTSTSPQYSMIASLDVARKQAVMEGYKLLARTLALAQRAAQQINSTGVFRVLELEDLLPDEVRARRHPARPDQGDGGHLRAAATPWTNCSSELFERYNIQVEKSTFNTLTPAADDRHHAQQGLAPVRRADAHRARAARAAAPVSHARRSPAFTQLQYLPRDAFYCGGELVPLLDDKDKLNRALDGRVCADQITPYPPGIPVLVPGQVITAEDRPSTWPACCASRSASSCTASSTTATCPACGCCTPAEERGLKRIG